MEASATGEDEPDSKRPKKSQIKPLSRWFLYPRASTKFCKGDDVFFRPKSAAKGPRGTIIEIDKSHALIKMESGQKKNVSIKRLVPIYNATTTQSIILTADTTSYRHLSASQITDKDVVLEIGCSTGEASVILSKYSASFIGFDISKSMVETCRTKLGDDSPRVFQEDVLTNPIGVQDLVHSELGKSPTAIYIDIGGNRNDDSTLRIIHWALETYSPRLVVVKNQALVKELSKDCECDEGRIIGAHEWFQQQVASASMRKVPRHALQAPLVYSPVDNATPICRYYNYDECKRKDCPLDHAHCHACRNKGHVARECSTFCDE